MHHAEVDWASYLPDEHTADLVEAAREQFSALTTGTPQTPDTHKEISDTLWPSLVEHGYTGLGLPEDVGGFGTLRDSVAVLEEASIASLPAPLLLSQICSHTLTHSGLLDASLAQRRGSLRIASESASHMLWGGSSADFVVTVAAPEAHRTEITISELASSAKPDPASVDPSRPIAIIDPSALTSNSQITLDISLDQLLGTARLLVAADLVGTAQSALSMAVSHAQSRTQFGREIGSFQGIKHPLADIHVAIDSTRSLIQGAAVSALNDPFSVETEQLSLYAKALASEVALRATQQNVQVHGAMGLTRESRASWLVRRARATAPFLGDHRELYARAASRSLGGKNGS